MAFRLPPSTSTTSTTKFVPGPPCTVTVDGSTVHTTTTKSVDGGTTTTTKTLTLIPVTDFTTTSKLKLIYFSYGVQEKMFNVTHS